MKKRMTMGYIQARANSTTKDTIGIFSLGLFLVSLAIVIYIIVYVHDARIKTIQLIEFHLNSWQQIAPNRCVSSHNRKRPAEKDIPVK